MFSWFGASPNPVNLVDLAFGWFMIFVFLDALLVGIVMGYYLWKRGWKLGPAWRATKKWVCITNDVVLLYLIDLQLLFVGTMVLGASGKALFALWILCGVGVRLTRIHKATARGLFKAAAIVQGIMAGVGIVFASMMGGFGEVASFTSSTTGQWVSLVLIAVTYGIFAKAMTPAWRPEELKKLEADRRKQEKTEEHHQGKLFEMQVLRLVRGVGWAHTVLATPDARQKMTDAVTGGWKGLSRGRTDQKAEKKADGSSLDSAKGVFEMAWKPVRFLVIVGAVLVGLSLIFGILVNGCSKTIVGLAGSSPAAYARGATQTVTAPKPGAINLDAKNESGVKIGRIPSRGYLLVKPTGTINVGMQDSQGVMGSSWHTGEKYGDKTLRRDLPTGCVLLKVSGGRIRGLSELTLVGNGWYKISGRPGQVVRARVNESPGDSSNNTGTFSFRTR